MSMGPRTAMSKEDFDRSEKGLNPRARVVVVRPEPEPPKVENLKTIADVPEGEEIEDVGQRMVSQKNKDGVRFCGYDIYLKFKSGKALSGWMDEGNWAKVKKRIPIERLDLIKKATF